MTTTTTRARSSVWNGMLSAIAMISLNGAPAMSATLTKDVKGTTVHTPVTVTGEALDAVKDIFVEGPVSFYGKLVDGTFEVAGPDLRARTLAKTGDAAVASTPAPKAAAKTASVKSAPKATVEPVKVARGVYEGTLSNVKFGTSARSGEYVAATFVTSVKGVEVKQTVLASGEALEKTRHLFVDGPAAFYAEAKDAKTMNVIGPDLRKKTLAAQGEAVAA